MISAKEVAATAAKALDEKKGLDLALIEITDISTLADYFLICTATSNTHVKTLCDAVEEALEATASRSSIVRVTAAAHGCCWISAASLCTSLPRKRGRYDLERLWQDGKRLNLASITG